MGWLSKTRIKVLQVYTNVYTGQREGTAVPKKGI
jgi:hypothetical protein